MRRLGQHFLTDNNLLRKIAAAAAPREGETVIEIGAGHGELTQELLRQNPDIRMIVLEKDAVLARTLAHAFAPSANVTVFEGDALRLVPTIAGELKGTDTPYRLAGNIPYYLTGRLLRIIGELEHIPISCVFTLQKEVAERMIAEPPRMNRLAASVGFWAEPEILFAVPSSSFRPPPKVESATVRLTAREPGKTIGKGAYYHLVRTLFQQPRKTIANNLIPHAKREVARKEVEATLIKIGVKPDARPQNLSLHDLMRMSEALSPLLSEHGRG